MVQIKLRLNPLVPHNLVYVAATFAKLEIPVPEKRLRKIAIHTVHQLLFCDFKTSKMAQNKSWSQIKAWLAQNKGNLKDFRKNSRYTYSD